MILTNAHVSHRNSKAGEEATSPLPGSVQKKLSPPGRNAVKPARTKSFLPRASLAVQSPGKDAWPI